MESLLKYYQDARGTALEAAGRAWYVDAGAACAAMAEEFQTTRAVAAGIVAALSPRMPWKRNLAEARNVLARVKVTALGASVRKAERILAGEAPEAVLATGPKTLAFYRALAGDSNAIVIDVWMLRALGHNRDSVTARQYTLFEETIRNAAQSVECAPAAFQAIVWCAIRGSGE